MFVRRTTLLLAQQAFLALMMIFRTRATLEITIPKEPLGMISSLVLLEVSDVVEEVRCWVLGSHMLVR